MTLIRLEATDGLTYYVNPDHIQGIMPTTDKENRLISKVWVASRPEDWGIEVFKDPGTLARDICHDMLAVV